MRRYGYVYPKKMDLPMWKKGSKQERIERVAGVAYCCIYSARGNEKHKQYTRYKKQSEEHLFEVVIFYGYNSLFNADYQSRQVTPFHVLVGVSWGQSFRLCARTISSFSWCSRTFVSIIFHAAIKSSFPSLETYIAPCSAIFHT